MQASANCEGGAGGSCHAYASVLINKYNFSASAGNTHKQKRQQAKQQLQQQCQPAKQCMQMRKLHPFICLYRTLMHTHTHIHTHRRPHSHTPASMLALLRFLLLFPQLCTAARWHQLWWQPYFCAPYLRFFTQKRKQQRKQKVSNYLYLALSFSLTLFAFSLSFFLGLSFILSLCLYLPLCHTLSLSFSDYLYLTAYRISVRLGVCVRLCERGVAVLFKWRRRCRFSTAGSIKWFEFYYSQVHLIYARTHTCTYAYIWITVEQRQ